MTIELVTGNAGGKAHVGSVDFGRLNAFSFGAGEYIMKGLGDEELAASMLTSNKLKAGSANIMAQGRHIYVNSEGIEWTIQNGTQGQKRIDKCVFQYVKDAETGVETVSPLTIKGTPSESAPVVPDHIKGDVLNGKALEAHIPAFTVALDGLSVSEPIPLLPKRELPVDGILPVSRGGTGATTTKEACANLGAFAGNAGGLSDVTPAALYNVAPGAYTVSPTATGSPCPGQYGNMVVSRSGGDRTWAVVAFDQGGCYMLSGWTKDSTTAPWVRIDGGCKVLSTESGAFMHGGQTIRLSDKVSNQPTGIVIVWSYYNDSASKSENQHFVYQFVPKSHVEHYDGCGVTLQVATGATFSFIAQKYVFVSDSAITGHTSNAENGAKNGVTFNNRFLALRGVLGV